MDELCKIIIKKAKKLALKEKQFKEREALIKDRLNKYLNFYEILKNKDLLDYCNGKIDLETAIKNIHETFSSTIREKEFKEIINSKLKKLPIYDILKQKYINGDKDATKQYIIDSINNEIYNCLINNTRRWKSSDNYDLTNKPIIGENKIRYPDKIIKRLVNDFKNSDDIIMEVHYLDNLERKYIHQLCNGLKYQHDSDSRRNDRVIIIAKKDFHNFNKIKFNGEFYECYSCGEYVDQLYRNLYVYNYCEDCMENEFEGYKYEPM